jgi:YD repeat-containing protein
VSGRVVTLSGLDLLSSATVTLTYGSGGDGSSAMPPAGAQGSTFAAEEASTASGTLTALAPSPTVSVTNAPAGSGTLSASPGSVIAGSATTEAFVYMAAAGGTSSGRLAIAVPAGWSAPSATSGTAGYTTSSAGTVSVSGRTATVSGLTLAANATVTVAYGAGGGTSAALVPSTTGNSTFSAKEAPGATGTLVALPAPPAVEVTTSPDGSGSATVSPSSVAEAKATTFTFTYVAPAGGLDAGSVSLTVPAGWAAPSATSGSQGYLTATAGTLSISGQVATVSGLGLASGAKLKLTYKATTPKSAGNFVFALDEATTSTGTLTPLSSPPAVTVYAKPVLSALSPPDGPTAGGTEVTVDGSALAGASVSFGTVAATDVVVAPGGTSLTALSPQEAAGTVNVTVTTPGGTSATSAADQFTYLPVPTVSSVSPTAGPVAGGTTVTVGGTGFVTGATAVLFGTEPASGVTVGSPTSLTAVSPSEAAGTVDVTVTTPGGTSATSAADRFGYVGAPSASELAASPPGLLPAGGTSTFSSSLENATGCTWSVAPALVGYPVTVPCSAQESQAIAFPANTSSATQYYTVTLAVSGPGGKTSVSTDLSVGSAALEATASRTVTMGSGQVSTFAGSGSPGIVDGRGTQAGFLEPGAEVVVGGELYVDDYRAIRKVDLSSGQVSTLAGQPSSYGCNNSTVPSQVTMEDTGLATDGTSLYSLCGGYLRRTDIATGATSTVGDVGGGGGYLTVGPDGAVYMTDGSAGTGVMRVDPATGAVTQYLAASAFGGQCTYGIAADASDLWVAASGWDNPVWGEICSQGPWDLYEVPLGTAAPTAKLVGNYASTQLGQDALVSAGSYLYADAGLQGLDGSVDLARISKADGSVTFVAGSGSSGDQDGTGLDAWFGQLSGIASDGTGLWAADGANYEVRQVVASPGLPAGLAPTAAQTVSVGPGQVSTFAGSGSSAVVDGTGAQASFLRPGAEAVVGGELYVDDYYAIREVDLSSGQVSTLAGQPSSSGCNDSADPSQVTMADSGLATDGVALYSLCGGLLRRTDIATGATSTVADVGSSSGQLTVGPDGSVYVTTGRVDGGVLRVDPATGAVTQYVAGPGFNGQCTYGVAADANDLWVAAGGHYSPYSGGGCSGYWDLYEVPLGTASPVPALVASYSSDELGETALVSAGSYLYADAGAAGLDASVDLARISKADGSVAIVAGSGSSGDQDGTGLDAWFGQVTGIASDGTDLWVADGADYDVREVVAGSLPSGLSPTATETVGIAGASGRVSTFAGSGTSGHVDGTGAQAGFAGPAADVVVSGHLYVADGTSVREVDLSSGQVSTLAGQASASPGYGCADSTDPSQVTMTGETALATDGAALYTLCWSDYNEYLRRTDIATGATSTLADLGWASGQLTVGPDGAVYVTTGQGGVTRVDPGTGAVTQYLPASAFAGQCTYGVAADATDLWVAASGFSSSNWGEICSGGPWALYEVPIGAASPTATLVASYPSAELGRYALVSAGAYLYADAGLPGLAGSVELARISKADGSLTYVAGSGSAGDKDGTGPDAWFGGVTGIASDGTDLWVVDGPDYDVREVTAGPALATGLSPAATETVSVTPGRVSTLAGSGTSAIVDGTGTGASFLAPGGEVVVGGDLYVDDRYAIRKVDLSTGQVSTLAGQASAYGCNDSTEPSQVTMEGSGLATDGAALYSTCGAYLRRTDIATGATSSVADVGASGNLTVGPDGSVYIANGTDGVDRVDPTTGAVTQYLAGPAFGGQCTGAVAADAHDLWVAASGYDNPIWGEICSQGPWDIYEVPLGSAAPVPTLVGSYPSTEVGDYALASAGNYLYADTTLTQQLPDGQQASGPGVVRIAKSNGTYSPVAGSPATGYVNGVGPAAELGSVSGLASDGTNLWVADGTNFVIRGVVQGPPPTGPAQTAVQEVGPVAGPVTHREVFGGTNPVLHCGCEAPLIKKNAIAPGTGDLVEASQDISVPGAGMALGLSRTYDSGLAQLQVTAGTAPGPLGYGWSYDLGMSVSVGPSSGVATVDQEDGSEVSFSPYVAGSSPSWCLPQYDYCADQPRTLATLEQGPDGSWAFVRDSSGQETFDFSPTGALVAESDQAGDTLTSAPGQPGSGACPASAASCTVWASSASGRSLTLAFDSSGRLTSASDGAGNTVDYCYFGQACAGGATAGGPQDLYSVVVPGGATTTYGYDASDATASFDHDIVSETLPGGGTVGNTYDSSGRVVSQVAPSDDVTLSYSGDETSVAGGSTVVSTWPAGTSGATAPQVVGYQFSSGALVGETTGYGTAEASTQYYDLDPTSLVPTTVQDGDGNQTSGMLADSSGAPMSAGDVTLSTDALGNTTQYEYTASNQTWCEVDPAEYLDGARCPAQEPTSPPAPGAASPWAGATISFYDAGGNLTATTDALGRTTVYSYTPSGLAVPAGLQYCSVGPVEYAQGVTCPAYGAPAVPGTTSSTFDDAGDVTSSTNADGATTTYAYTDPSHPGLATVTTDPDGDVTTVVYDAAGQVTSSTVSFGSYTATTLSAYDIAGQLYCTVAPQQVAASITCPSSPPSASSPPAGVTSDFYDANGDLVQQTGPTGETTVYAYDQAGQRFCTVGPQAYAAGVRCPSTEPASPPTVGDDPYLGATIETYDAQGQEVQETNPLGGITVSSYDAAGNLVSQTVETGDATSPADDPAVTTTYKYDADNRQLSETVAPGTPEASTALSYYDPDGNEYCSVSADAYATGSYQCPPWQPDWANSPPAVGSLYSSTPSPSQAEGVTTSFYDADRELVQQSGPDQSTTVSVHDADGGATCAMDAADMTSYLAAHVSAAWPYACPSTPATTAPATGSDPGYETTIYDPAGEVLSSTDAAGDTTSYTFDPDGAVLTTMGPSGQVTTNCYYWQTSSCAAGAPTGGGDATSLYSTTAPPAQGEPSGATTTYTYLPGGALATKTTAAGTVTDAYDAAGELTSVTHSAPTAGYSAAPDIAYTYDSAGDRTTMSDGAGVTTYAYDDAGDLLSAAFAAKAGSGLASATTSYSYYTNGERQSLTYPVAPSGDSPTVTQAYDAAGDLASMTDWGGRTIGFAHDPDGNTATTAYPNGTTVSATYDLGDAMTSLQASEGSPGVALVGIGYKLDSAEQVTSETDTGAISSSVAYGYDSADRLGTVTQGTGTAAAEAYDPSGDPTTLADGSTQSFNTAGQVLATDSPSGSTVAYGYNPTGDRTSSSGGSAGPATYAYDQDDQLASATVGSGTVSYTYDGDGLLTGRATAAGTVTDNWGTTSGTPLLLSDGTNDYLYGPNGTPVEQANIATGTPEYFVSDTQGSTRALLGASGSVDATFAYDAYGNLTASSGTATTPLLYDGQDLDTATGLYYLRAR